MAPDLRERLQSSLGNAYSVERELGGGGMSRVFVAQDVNLDRRVVVKVLPPEMAEGVSSERFTREIRLAARLQHPHIVPLLSAGETDGLPWFTMPLVEGESLRAKLARAGELPIADAVRVLREVASALAYAHGRGVVHRDIKPENILLSEGAAMVSDFGVAKAIVSAAPQSLTSLGVALGTPAYMAPEQGMADPRTDHRADIYAFGVLAYELLAGRTPFAGRSPQAMLAAHVTEAPDPVDRIRPATPPALAALVMRCLAKSPADRPQSAQEVVQALDAVTTPTTGTAPHLVAAHAHPTAEIPPSSAAAEARMAGRRRARYAAAGVVTLALLAGGWFAWSRTRVPDLAERRVAVAPFQNLTGDAQFDVVGRMAADWLAQSVARAESVDVVSSAAVAAAIADMPSGTNVVELLSRATRAGVVVTGSVFPQGDSLRLHAAVIDAKSGKALLSFDPATAPRSDPIIAIEALSERLLGAIAVDPSATFRQVPIRAPKYSAYREFLTAYEHFGRSRTEQARAGFYRAIALDSTIVNAYALLATSYSNAGMWDSSAAVTARLLRFRDRFTPDERTMAEWLEANLHGSDERQLAAAQKAAAQDSLPSMVYLVGLYANNTLRPRLAVRTLEASDSGMLSVGWFSQVTNLADAYHLSGNYEAELAMLRRRRRDYPSRPALLARDLRALAGLQRGADAMALADTLLRGTTDRGNTTITSAITNAAMEFEAHGDSATAAELARRVVEWHRRSPLESESRARAVEAGRAWLVLGVLDSARTAFARARRDTANVAARGWLGVTLALQGDTLRARATADSLGALRRAWLFGAHVGWQASILAALGDRDAAVRLLAQAHDVGLGKRTWHYEIRYRPLRGYPPFEALTAPKDD